MRTLTRSLMLLSTVTVTACAAPSTTASPPAPTTTVSQTVSIVSVADGDTITVSLDGRRTTVRLIGVDTPETKRPNTAVQCFGPQASGRTHALVDGARVQLETDPSGDRVDRYGRALAYVWLTDGTMLNYQLVADALPASTPTPTATTATPPSSVPLPTPPARSGADFGTPAHDPPHRPQPTEETRDDPTAVGSPARTVSF